MTKTTTLLTALAATTALATAGCGGGSHAQAPLTTKTTAAVDGHQIFTTVGCSNCHTLAAAGAKGQVGPDLDHVRPTFAKAVRQVTHGGGAMPPFAGQLSDAEIRAVARYVSANAGR
ncbi:c-type cytochrome [Conexibacter woesei]|uniref:c-type cytochrome n=1 Tax=Conexibacter woesei TaxID=191495 RepID=UPI0003FDC4B2|nr:cytochrome c [Conexibacter woesei]